MNEKVQWYFTEPLKKTAVNAYVHILTWELVISKILEYIELQKYSLCVALFCPMHTSMYDLIFIWHYIMDTQEKLYVKPLVFFI